MNRWHSHICELSLTRPLKRSQHASVESVNYTGKFEPPLSNTGSNLLVKIGSIIGFGMAVVGLLFLIQQHHLLSTNPMTIVIQLGSIALMVWARITFGRRSFHVPANTTRGALVTTGPYRWIRHPVYAAVIYFSSASIIAYPQLDTLAGVLVIIGGLFLRMRLEEKSLLEAYDQYAEYARRTKRIIPFTF